MREMTVGLLPAPELPEKVARSLTETLPDALNKYIDANVEWNVEVIVDPLTGAAETADEISEEAKHAKEMHNWDYAISVTDLPVFSKKDIVLAISNVNEKVTQISLPAFGLFPMRKRLKDTIIQMVRDLHMEKSNQMQEMERGMFKQINHKISRVLSPVRRKRTKQSQDTIYQYFVIPRLNGKLRITLGMVHANRPWKIFSSFKKVIAIAFATGAYGLIFPSLWNLSVVFEPSRYILLMVTSLGSMVLWIMLAHHLWEKPSYWNKRKMRRIYNTTTVITLSVAVLFYYIILFGLFFLAVRLFVPEQLFRGQSVLHGNVTIVDYLHLTWLVTSVATLGGAIGAGLEDDELVSNATYGYRQQKRYEQSKRDQENA
ncbi:hypothetical protein NC661_03670 [Aquibacillus koreensis]|uniref:5,10-methylene-tetrahydrofolate dehydrogenase n=1 Tax=Aquibacillus koreensis TaxID=279446 RepID=A0A9X3WJ20_9BACI|nr:hypothetical protein [Aquibacillus koreensis]MCT2536451.1 hypothetical protein [Aquibacillus koreensis]MDC3419460.1 hypothetical protein [Aquibacillus koreensis]